MKRILSILVTLSLVLSIFPVTGVVNAQAKSWIQDFNSYVSGAPDGFSVGAAEAGVSIYGEGGLFGKAALDKAFVHDTNPKDTEAPLGWQTYPQWNLNSFTTAQFGANDILCFGFEFAINSYYGNIDGRLLNIVKADGTKKSINGFFAMPNNQKGKVTVCNKTITNTIPLDTWVNFDFVLYTSTAELDVYYNGTKVLSKQSLSSLLDNTSSIKNFDSFRMFMMPATVNNAYVNTKKYIDNFYAKLVTEAPTAVTIENAVSASEKVMVDETTKTITAADSLTADELKNAFTLPQGSSVEVYDNAGNAQTAGVLPGKLYIKSPYGKYNYYSLETYADTSVVKTYPLSFNTNGSSILLTCDGETSDIGDLKTAEFEMGKTITVKALNDDKNKTFMYWKNEQGIIVSSNEEYTFTTGSSASISAVYSDSSLGCFVTFKNANGRIIAAGQAGAIEVPQNPYIMGYAFNGWYSGGNLYPLAPGDELSSIEKDTIFNAGYKKSEIIYSVTINGVTESYPYNAIINVTASDTNDNSESFLYWTKNSSIVSYNKNYSCFVSGDMTLTAVYGSASVEKKDVITIMAEPTIVEINKLAFFAEFNISEKYEIVEMGILLGQTSGLSIDNYSHKATSASKRHIHQFTVRKANVTTGETWYGKAYVILKDEEGNLVTEYSDEVSKTAVVTFPITALLINTPSNLEQVDNRISAVNFSLQTTPDKDVDKSTVEWYVNDVLCENTSEDKTQFSYKPAGAGEYEVYAKVNASSVKSDVKTIRVTEAEKSDVFVLNEQFNYSAGYDFKATKPDIWTNLNITGNGEARESASVKVVADAENPGNMILSQIPTQQAWQGNRLEKSLPEIFTQPMVITGLIKMSHINKDDPTFTITLTDAKSGTLNLLQFTTQTDGRIFGTNGVTAYVRSHNEWVRYTLLLTPNTANLSQSKAKFMFSGDVAKSNNGAKEYIITQEYTADLSKLQNLATLAPGIRFSYAYGGTLGGAYESFHDDIRIYYPKLLSARLEKATNVFADEAINVEFNHIVNPATITDANIILKDDMGNSVKKSLEFDSLSPYSVKIIPEDNLSYGKEYTVEFTSGLTDISGYTISAPLSFKTASESDENSIKLNKSELSLTEGSSDDSVEVYLNSALAAEDDYTVTSDNDAVAVWRDGSVISGISGECTLSFVSKDKTSKAKLLVTVTKPERSADYIKSVEIPSQAVTGDKLISMDNGVITPEWSTAEGSAPEIAYDATLSENALTFASSFNYGVNTFLEASSKYVFEMKAKFDSSCEDAVIYAGGLSPLFTIKNGLNVYAGKSDTASLTLDAGIWYHLKAVLTTDENFRVSDVRFFIDDAEIYSENQAATPAQAGAFCIKSENGGAASISDIALYKTVESPVKSVKLPSETVEGVVIYTNSGEEATWDYLYGAPSLSVYDKDASDDILNTALVIKNTPAGTVALKKLSLSPESTYVYETKMKLLSACDNFKITVGNFPLLTVSSNNSGTKKLFFGNNTEGGYIQNCDEWFVFKAIINLDNGKKISSVNYYINSAEVYQDGQEPLVPFKTADSLAYINQNLTGGEAVCLDDTYIYKTLWLTGVTADIFSLDVSGEEFNTASQVTHPGDAELELTLTNGTRLATTPKVIVEYYDSSSALLNAEDMALESEIAPGESVLADMPLNIPDNIEGGVMKINVYDASGETQLTQPIEKTLNTGGKLFLESVYSDNSVIQRDVPIKISGIAPTGSTVTATFASDSASVVAQNNRFTVTLPAQAASFEGQSLTITATGENFSDTKTINNILVGDVYYASGQSNMDWRMDNTPYGDHTIPENVRYIKIAYTKTADQRVDRHTDQGLALNEVWKTLDSTTINGCASVMFFMAQKIRNSGVDVPIGIIDCSLGGTSISAWVGEDVFAKESAYSSYYQQYLNGNKNIGCLYNFMFKPISSYPFKAMVWYQGEQDFASEYEKLLPPMVKSYREATESNFPILVVQLPGLNQVYRDIRFRQAYAVSNIENAHLIVTNDTGDPVDVHPANKDIVGARLADVALNKLYGLNVPYSGPRFKAMTVSGNVATVEFDFAGDENHGTLCSMNDDSSLPGFELAGSDGKFYPATATITSDGTRLELVSESVLTPVYVRYGYVGEIFTSLGNNTNGYILPAGCFRTDGKF